MLTAKAKQFLKKYKDGGVPTYQVGAITPKASMYQVADPYNLPTDTTQFNMGQTIHNETPVPFLSTPITPVQQVNPLGTNIDMGAYKAPPAGKKNPLEGLDMGMFSPLVNIGIGISELIKSGKRKKEQKEYEKLFNADLERRQEEARTQGYYNTPYMQQGGNFMKEVDQFMNYYTNKEAQEKTTQQQFEDLYTEENNRKLVEWKAQQASGIGNIVSGAAGVATKLLSPAPTMQQGGVYGQASSIKDFAKKLLANKHGGKFQTMGVTNPDYVLAAISGNKIDRTMQTGGTWLADSISKKDSTVWDTLYEQPLDTLLNKPDTTSMFGKKAQSSPGYTNYIMPKSGLTPQQIDQEIAKMPKETRERIQYQVEFREAEQRQDGKVRESIKSVPKGVRYREKEDGGYVEVPDWSIPVRFQQGGEIDPELDLYSPEFNPNKFLGKEELIQPEIEQEDQAIESQATVSNWLFGDDNDDPYRELLTDAYSQGVDFNYSSPSEAPIGSVVSQLEAMGIKPSSVTGGQHNVGSKHYEGKALDLGINTSFGGDAKKMDEFYQYLQSPQGKQKFPNVKVIDERVRPAGQKVWSNPHLHLEIE